MRSFLVLGLSVLLFSSCKFMGRRVRGNGIHGSEQRTVRDFNRLEVSGDIDVVLAQGTPSVRIEGDQNLLQYVELDQSGSTLRVHLRRHINISTENEFKVYVTGPGFRSVEVTGSGDVTGSGRLRGENLKLGLTGSGSVTLDVDMPRVRAEVTGSGDARLSGATRTFEGEINGSGNISAFGLMSEDTKVEIHGSGDAEVFASKQLNVDIAGSGDVAYKGTASVNQSVHGSGSVRRVN
ncbi:DUF2807 domain-containing protein [Flaviaesturariibacter flavus]|uniref:DUF2807 domain-containing protein n=1 Tax=Flaviaesturariibacter flavus TaxID=2502780 RepID=A0A4R1BKB1_9BACT|nr:head GIN domain-containing protein [Flaviaesturariibacter flavus]TCJ17764.1 DUF2807 domain-containing protein [Flaviaesturariibacter flavus]